MVIGDLKIRIIKATNLKAGDKNGLSDPLVEIWQRKTIYKNVKPKFSRDVATNHVNQHFHRPQQEQKETKVKTTKTIKKTLNPEWNEEFIFPDVELYENHFELKVFDYDFIGKNDLLGTTSIFISDAFYNYDTEYIFEEKMFENGVLTFGFVISSPTPKTKSVIMMDKFSFTHPSSLKPVFAKVCNGKQDAVFGFGTDLGKPDLVFSKKTRDFELLLNTIVIDQYFKTIDGVTNLIVKEKNENAGKDLLSTLVETSLKMYTNQSAMTFSLEYNVSEKNYMAMGIICQSFESADILMGVVKCCQVSVGEKQQQQDELLKNIVDQLSLCKYNQ